MKTRITYVAVFGFVDSAENHVADLVCHFAVAADPVCHFAFAVDLVYHFVAALFICISTYIHIKNNRDERKVKSTKKST